MAHIIHNKPPLKIYYSRVKMGAWALFWAALVALGVWMLLDPTMLQDSTDRLIAGLWIALVGAFLLLTLYGVLTPLPLLVVDEHGLTCQPFPWVRRTFAWADVADVTAVKDTIWSAHGPHVILTLEFHLKPYAVAAYGNKPRVKLGISPLLLPMPAEELVGRVQGYHAVNYHVLGG